MESRRSFVKKTAVAGSAAIVAPTIVPARAFGANDRINAAVLGLNGRGKSHVKGLMVQDNTRLRYDSSSRRPGHRNSWPILSSCKLNGFRYQ